MLLVSTLSLYFSLIKKQKEQLFQLLSIIDSLRERGENIISTKNINEQDTPSYGL